MNLFSEAEAYIRTHAVNLGTDVIQHLKAFAASVDAKVAPEIVEAETDLKADVKVAESYVESKAEAVESAVKEIEQHTETAFADLLAAQATKPATPTESK